MSARAGHIGKLDYHPRQPQLQADEAAESSERPSDDFGHDGRFFEHVAEGILERDRARMRREVIRYGSFTIAIINCLCAGSITAYSLYGHLFQSRLHYTQVQVNIVSITAELGMYLPVPLFGYVCDRYGPRPPSLFAGVVFGLGYLLAALTYKSGAPPSAGGSGWPFGLMVLAFVGVGMGTSCMYLTAVTTCAKNFGRGKHKGLALAMPIAAVGLSGMWQSQVGSRILYEKGPNGERGDVDVYRYFLFLGGLLLSAGILGTFALKIVDEEEMIDEAVSELERSGLLEDSPFFQRPSSASPRGTHRTYGTLSPPSDDEESDLLHSETPTDHKRRPSEDARRKAWLLNAETRLFLSDSTMWWLAAGFFLVTGPGEAFINNVGTIIGTLYTPPPFSNDPASPTQPPPTSAATHVSIVAVTSTVARIVSGTLSDLLAPIPSAHQHRQGPNSLTSSFASLRDPLEPFPAPTSLFRLPRISRVAFLLTFSLCLSVGFALLASGLIQDRAQDFWIVSALIGTGYGASFSLVPIIISVVWGVENFGTNWGIVAVMPAFGATVYGAMYAAVYENATGRGSSSSVLEKDELLCYGKRCYVPTFWVMFASVWVACGIWLWAWKGSRGWSRRGITV